MGRRYLVTGGAGFIGSHLVSRLDAENAAVRVLDSLSTGNLARLDALNEKIEFVVGDLSDEDVVARAVNKVDGVFHQAAIPSVQRSIRDPVVTHRANATATLHLLEGCRRANVRRIIYAASSSAYGNTESLPKVEGMLADPLSPYALQKWVGEHYCKLYYELYGLETVSLRYFNVFGPGQDPHSEYSAVIPKFISALLTGEAITVYGDGEQSRDFTYVDNVVAANLLAMRAGSDALGKVFNVGCGDRSTLNSLIRTLEHILNIKANVDYAQAREGDVRHSLADISLARRILGYTPAIKFEEGLRRTVEAMKRA